MNNIVKEKKVSLKELIEEVTDMLNVCFEGEAKTCDDGIVLSLDCGQKFHISISAI